MLPTESESADDVALDVAKEGGMLETIQKCPNIVKMKRAFKFKLSDMPPALVPGMLTKETLKQVLIKQSDLQDKVKDDQELVALVTE